MEKRKPDPVYDYLNRLAMHGPKLIKNIFLILAGGVAGATGEVVDKIGNTIKDPNFADRLEEEWEDMVFFGC